MSTRPTVFMVWDIMVAILIRVIVEDTPGRTRLRMNCISGHKIQMNVLSHLPLSRTRQWMVAASIFLIGACGGPATEPAAAEDTLEYETHYRIRPDRLRGVMVVELELRQPRHLLREVRFRVDDSRFAEFSGDGELAREQEILRWSPPAGGGTLRWQSTLSNRRNDNGYDAWLGKDWGIFRAEDIIPRAATRTLKGATSLTSLSFELPSGWSAVTEYRETEGIFTTRNASRRFKQPAGWVAIGELGVRRDRIAGVRVAIAAPVDNGVRRLDMLALLNWTLPELARIVPDMPTRLTIISAGEPMWRGGLSAPASLFIHADRPLLSENGTSTLLHEVMHVALGLRAVDGDDWIVEGLAEYFSLELLRRSGTLSTSRNDRARRSQQEWSKSSVRLCGGSSTGATTARAVAVFIELDDELRQASDGEHSLDDVATKLRSSNAEIDIDMLIETASTLIGANPEALHVDKLPGCRKIAADDKQP